MVNEWEQASQLTELTSLGGAVLANFHHRPRVQTKWTLWLLETK